MGKENEQVQEINDVLEGMGMQAAPETPPADTPTEQPSETPPVVEDKTGEPGEPVEAVKTQETPAPGEPPPVVDAAPPASPPADDKPVEEDELARLRRENAEFREQLLAQARDAMKPATPAAPAAKPATPAGETPPAEEKRGAAVLPFFKEDKDIDEAFKDVQNANAFMTKVVATAVEFVAKNMPAAIERISDQQIMTRMAVKEFYDNNTDLRPYSEYCGYITNKVQAEQPNLSLAELLEKVAVESRKALKLAAQAGEPIPAGAQTSTDSVEAGRPAVRKGPALPPVAGGGRKSGPPNLSGLEKEIAEIIDLQ